LRVFSAGSLGRTVGAGRECLAVGRQKLPWSAGKLAADMSEPGAGRGMSRAGRLKLATGTEKSKLGLLKLLQDVE